MYTILYHVAKEVKQRILDDLDDNVGLDEYVSDLHNELCNTNVFRTDIKLDGPALLQLVGLVATYELDNCEEMYTDLTSRSALLNMFAYIVGEKILDQAIDIIKLDRDGKVTEADLDLLRKAVFLSDTLTTLYNVSIEGLAA